MKTGSPEWQRLRDENQLRRAQFVQALTTEDKIALADSWVNTYDNEDEANYELWKDFDRKVRMCLSDSNVGFEVIEMIWSRLSGDHDLSFLGVLVEDWLSLHGDKVIAQLEQLTVKDRLFADVLQFVYPNTMPKQVYLRVKALAGNKNS